MKYIDFELQIKQDEQGRYIALTTSRDQEFFTLPFSDDFEKVIKSIGEALTQRHTSPQAPNLITFGQQLFDAVFQDRIRITFATAYTSALNNRQRLRIKLNIMSPDLMGLPWEFLYTKDLGIRNFLALSHNTVITRYAEGREAYKPPSDGLVPPLRILGVVAAPSEMGELNANREKQLIENSLSGLIKQGLAWIDWLEQGTLEALQNKIGTRDRDYHIFHFIGHAKKGYLAFEDSDVDGETLSLVLGGQPYLRVAILNACQSAQISGDNPFSSVATALVKGGIPAVVAMQYAIRDTEAIKFSKQVYEALAQMQPIERAVTDGRISLKLRPSGEWGIPVLYLSIPGDEIFPLSFDPKHLESQIRSLIDNHAWEEAANLCELLKVKAPHLYETATCLQALARAYIYKQQQDWEKVLEYCDEGLAHIEGDDFLRNRHLFENLRREANIEREAATLLEEARSAFRQGRLILAKDICTKLNRRNREAQALLLGIEIEEKLTVYKHELEENYAFKNWFGIQQIAKMGLRHVGTPDSQLAGVDFPNYTYFSELADLADAHSKAQSYLAKEDWEQAEILLQRIRSRRRDLCPEEDLLYVQSRLYIATGKKSEAIVKLKGLQEIKPGYRDSAQLLQALINEVKERERLQQLVETYLSDRKWEEALDICKQIKADTPNYTLAPLESALTYILEFFPRIRSSLIADPNLRWPQGLPYNIFAPLGITSQSSIEAVNNASYELQLQDSEISTEQQAAWDCLRSVPSRLYLDAFLYPNHPQRIIEFFESFLLQHRTMPPSPEQLKSGIPDEAPLVLLLMGHRELAAQIWEEQQQETPSDSRVAHQLGLLYYWWAQKAGVQEYWHKAIGNWALILEDETFWQKWSKERRACYGVSTANHLAEVRQKLENKFTDDLASKADLSLTFQVEITAARRLRAAGGFLRPGSMFDKIACGPIMIHMLGLETQLARFIAVYNEDANKNIDKKLEYLNNSTDLLQRYFSQLGPATILLDRDQPEQALAALTKTDYTTCPRIPGCSNSTANTNLPGVYCAACPHFEQANPAYRRLPDRGRALLDDALDIAITAHLRLAEQTLTGPKPVLSTVGQHWRQAVTLAAATSKSTSHQEEVRSSIKEIALGRARFLLQKARDGEGKGNFSWYDDIYELYQLSLEITGQNSDFTDVLADALMLRGVRRATLLDDPVGSESDLRKAFELNPHSLAIRIELVISKKDFALYAQRKGELSRAKEILADAQRLALYGLEISPENKALQEELGAIQILLATWEDADNDVLVDRPYINEIEHLERKLQEKPTDQEIYTRLLELLIEFSEDLSIGSQRAFIITELERRLPLFTNEPRLYNQINFVREGYKIEGYLRAANLKFFEAFIDRANRTFRLPFVSSRSWNINIFIDVIGDIATITGNLPPLTNIENSQLPLALLQTFHEIPFYKPCWKSDTREMTLVAECPVELLTQPSLDTIAQAAWRYVEINPAITNSLHDIDSHFKNGAHLAEQFNESQRPPDLIPSVCSQANISCQEHTDNTWTLCRTPDSPQVTASYNGIAVRFSVEGNNLTNRNQTTYLQLMAINASTGICKVALDSQQKVLFICELPDINEKWILRALEALEDCILHFSKDSF